MVKNQNVAFDLLRKELDHAANDDEKLKLLRQLVSLNPKSVESLQARSKYKEQLSVLAAKQAQKGGSGQGSDLYQSIVYARQMVLVGQTNTGKSTLLELLTGTHTKISDAPYTTYKPEVGMFYHKDIPIQVIEIPSLYSGDQDSSKYNFIRNSDVLCLVAQTDYDILATISQLEDYLIMVTGCISPKYIHKNVKKEEIVQKPTFFVSWSELAHSDLSSANFHDTNSIGDLVYSLLNVQRIYGSKDGVNFESPKIFSGNEVITVRDFAEKVNRKKGFKKAKLFGSSAAYPGQVVGLDYKLVDGDSLWLI